MRLLLLALAGVCMTPWLFAPSGVNSAEPEVIISQQVLINGVATRPLNWTGGALRADTNTAASGDKRVTNLTYDPIKVEVSLPLAAPYQALLADLCRNQVAPKTLVLTYANANGTYLGPILQANNAALIGVTYEDSATLSTLAKFIFTFQPESVTTLASVPTSTSAAISQTAFAAIRHNIDLNGLPPLAVPHVAGFSITRPQTASAGRAENIWGRAEFGNLRLTLSSPGAAQAWMPWYQDFLRDGKRTNNDEKDGKLTIYSSDGTPIFSADLLHVGLVRLTPTQFPNPKLLIYEAEIYFEGMTVALPSSVASGPASTDSAPPPPTASPAPAAAGDPVANAAPAPATDFPAGATPVAKANSGAPLVFTTATPEVAPAEGREKLERKPSVGVLPTPVDKGARDPANFPRPPGLVRTAYNQYKQGDSTQETVSYTSAQTADQVAEAYDKLLQGAGWKQYRRLENDSGAGSTHQILPMYLKDKDTAFLTLTDTRAGRTDIELKLTRVSAEKK